MGPAVLAGFEIHAHHQFGIYGSSRNHVPVQRGIGLQCRDECAVGFGRFKEFRNLGAHADMAGIIRHGIDQLGIVHRPEVHMGEIHQVHGCLLEVAQTEIEPHAAGPAMEPQTGPGHVVLRECDGVTIVSGQFHIMAFVIGACHEFGVAITRIGQFAMQGVAVAGARIAHGGCSAMEEKGPVICEIVHGVNRFVEHRTHGEAAAVKRGIPDLLALERQQDDLAHRVADKQCSNAASIAESAGRQFAVGGEDGFGAGEFHPRKVDGDRHGHGAISPRPPSIP